MSDKMCKKKKIKTPYLLQVLRRFVVELCNIATNAKSQMIGTTNQNLIVERSYADTTVFLLIAARSFQNEQENENCKKKKKKKKLNK
jgi:hypothetical protein